MSLKMVLAILAITWGLAPGAGMEKPTYALAPVQSSPSVTDAERQAFYGALMAGLCSRDSLRIVERKRLRLVLSEEGLMPSPSSDDFKAGLAGTEGLSASRVVLPGLCKVGNDYVLSVRVVQTRSKLIEACRIQTTRSISRFRSATQALLETLMNPDPSTGPSQSDPADTKPLANIIAKCRQAKADVLFPQLWSRCEKLRQSLSSGKPPAGLNSYYLHLLHLSSRAGQAPAGMVFVPGGYVTFRTSKDSRKLWIEPFFLDRQEVTVAAYREFLAHSDVASLRPITRGMDGFEAPELPVTGIRWTSAARYARWKGKTLPTSLQWLRAAEGDDGRRYPCGPAAALKECNLSGGSDGYQVLAPASRPGGDRCAFGVVGLTGNVREWTNTWYRSDMYERPDLGMPADPAQGVVKIVAGGGWRTPRSDAVCARLDKAKPREAFDDVGFRCALTFSSVLADRRAQQATGSDVNMSANDGRKENAK